MDNISVWLIAQGYLMPFSRTICHASQIWQGRSPSHSGQQSGCTDGHPKMERVLDDRHILYSVLSHLFSAPQSRGISAPDMLSYFIQSSCSWSNLHAKPLPLLPLVYTLPEEPPFHSSLDGTSMCFSPLLATAKPSL